jgi:hypothetical protein
LTLACCVMSETGDDDGHGVVAVVAENGEGCLNGALIKRASRECELAERARLEEPMGASNGEWKGRKGDEVVSGP